MPRGVYQRGPSKATPTVIRTLRPDEPVPDGEPRRYRDRDGYVRLRWRVGVRQYVEVREHRAIVGHIPDLHVHHLNHDTSDNRPENLVHMTPAEHAAHHAASQRRVDVEQAKRLYEAGLSTVQIGRLQGVDPSNVWRQLNRIGYRMRPKPGADLKTREGRTWRPLLLEYIDRQARR
jgi:hypothetical protein